MTTTSATPTTTPVIPSAPSTGERIAADLGVICTGFDPAREVERRVRFLVDYLAGSGASGYVLGISGGVDSLTAGRLAQLACERAGATFTAVRLPYGTQGDESDAQASIAFIGAHRVRTVNIAPAVDAMVAQLWPAAGTGEAGKAGQAAGAAEGGEAAEGAEGGDSLKMLTAAELDFARGNIKARQRMVAQYAIAGHLGALVIGTDQAAEAAMGFFTKVSTFLFRLHGQFLRFGEPKPKVPVHGHEKVPTGGQVRSPLVAK